MKCEKCGYTGIRQVRETKENDKVFVLCSFCENLIRNNSSLSNRLELFVKKDGEYLIGNKIEKEMLDDRIKRKGFPLLPNKDMKGSFHVKKKEVGEMNVGYRDPGYKTII